MPKKTAVRRSSRRAPNPQSDPLANVDPAIIEEIYRSRARYREHELDCLVHAAQRYAIERGREESNIKRARVAKAEQDLMAAVDRAYSAMHPGPITMDDVEERMWLNRLEEE